MTSNRLKQCLQIIRRHGPLSQRGLAIEIGYDERQVRRWTLDSEHNVIPAEVEQWLEKVTAFYQSKEMLKHIALVEKFYAENPPPARVRRKAA